MRISFRFENALTARGKIIVKIQKWAAVLLAVLMCLVLASCGAGTDQKENTSEAGASSEMEKTTERTESETEEPAESTDSESTEEAAPETTEPESDAEELIIPEAYDPKKTSPTRVSRRIRTPW